MSSLRVLTSLFCVSLLLLTLAPIPLFSQDEERALKPDVKENVDVVLVIDTSGSMLRTDPLRLRDQGSKLLIQFLNQGDRLAIVRFAERAEQIRPLDDYNGGQLHEIEQLISRIEADGIYTDLLSGIKLASQILDIDPRPDSDRVIVLLSDGQLDPDPAISSKQLGLSEMMDQLLPKLKESGIKLHTLALSELSDRRLLAQMAQITSGISWYAPNADTIHQSFAELFLAVKKPQVLALTSKGFPIDEGIKEATFYINRSESKDVALKSPTAEMITPESLPANVKWFRGEKFDVVTIDTPEVGDWKIDGLPSSDSFATLLTNLKLITEFPADSINSGDSVLLQARFYESRKPVALPQLSGVVNYTYEITPTDRVSEPVQKSTLLDDGENGDRRAGDGIFSADIKLEDEGEYKLTVTASAPTFVRQQQVPFRVKPRPVALSIEEAKYYQSEMGAQGGTLPEGVKEFFIVSLSDEGASLKNREVKLRATDPKRKIYNLKLTPIPGDKIRFRAPVAFPRENVGEYTLVAMLSGDGKNRRSYNAQSNIIKFNWNPNEESEEVQETVFEVQQKTPEKAFPWGGLILMSLINIAGGVGALSLLRKAVSGMSVAVTTYEPPEQIIKLLANLKKKASLTEIDVNDPIFSEASIAKLKESVLPEGDAIQSASAAPSPSETPSEPPAEAGAPASAEAAPSAAESAPEAPAAEQAPESQAAPEEAAPAEQSQPETTNQDES